MVASIPLAEQDEEILVWTESFFVLLTKWRHRPAEEDSSD